MAFDTWLDTFIKEKEIDPEHTFNVSGPSGMNIIPLEVLIEVMKKAPPHEQDAIRTKVVQMDFVNAPILPFFEHLCGAIAK